MDNDGVGALFRIEGVFIGQLNAYSGPIKQCEQLRLILEVRARRITEAVSRALIPLREEALHVRGITS